MHTAELDSLLHLETFCANVVVANSTILSSLNMTSISETIHSSLVEMDAFMDTRVQDASIGFHKVKEATSQIDASIYTFEENEWKLRLCMVVLIVVNIFLLIGLLLSRQNIAYNPYLCVCMYVLVPSFCASLVLTTLATYGFGASAVVNADFCAGGDYPGSPIGTIDAIMQQQGVSQRDIMYQSFHYYVNVSVYFVCFTRWVWLSC